MSLGTHNLIKQRVKLVNSVSDIIEELELEALVVISTQTMMEMKGKIKNLGKKYRVMR